MCACPYAYKRDRNSFHVTKVQSWGLVWELSNYFSLYLQSKGDQRMLSTANFYKRVLYFNCSIVAVYNNVHECFTIDICYNQIKDILNNGWNYQDSTISLSLRISFYIQNKRESSKSKHDFPFSHCPRIVCLHLLAAFIFSNSNSVFWFWFSSHLDEVLFMRMQNTRFRSLFEIYVDFSVFLSYALSKIRTVFDILKNEMSRITLVWLVWSGLWPVFKYLLASSWS